MKRAVAYIRVSSKQQAESGFGLRSQEAEIRGFAAAAGYRIVRFYRESASAITSSAKDRPYLQDALKCARRHRVPIIVAKLDRLSRKTDELEELVNRSGVKIISARNGAETDPLVLGREAARVAEETRMLKERTLEGLRRAKQQGKVLGNTTNLPEAQRLGAAANRRIAQLRAEELEQMIEAIPDRQTKTSSEIAKIINKRGFLTPRGKPWSGANLRRILRRLDQKRAEESAASRDHEGNPLFGIF